MKLIVGLGNPGKKYANSRHNFGFMTIDKFAKERGLSWRYNLDWTAYYIKTDNFVLLKPVTFMNKSGVSTVAASRFFKIDKKDILIIHDEIDLPFGKIRISFDSLSAGHKGVDSIIQYLSGVEFGRLRLGIGPTSSRKAGLRGVKKPNDVEKFVLREFTKEEDKKLQEVSKIAIEALNSYLEDGIDMAMNRFN